MSRFQIYIKWRSSKDLKKIWTEDLSKSQKYFRKKLLKDILKILKEKGTIKIFIKSFHLQKVFRYREDLHKRCACDLIFQKISKKIWVLGYMQHGYFLKILGSIFTQLRPGHRPQEFVFFEEKKGKMFKRSNSRVYVPVFIA